MLRGSLVLAVLLAASVVAAEDYKVGDRVVVIKQSMLTADNAAGVEVGPGLTLMVEDVMGDRLWVSNGAPGWLEKSNVVKSDQGIDYFTRALKADPTNTDFRYARAMLWEERGEFDTAIAEYNELIRVSPGESVYYASRGIAWGNSHLYDRAIEDFNVAIQFDPKGGHFYEDRGVAWGEKSEYDKAIADFNQALHLDPKNVIAYVNRGIVWKEKRGLR